MTKKQQAFLALAALALPLSAFAVDMPGGLAPETPQTLAHLSAEAAISLLYPAIVHISPSLFQAQSPARAMTAAPRSAAKADVQAMLAPEQPVVPKAVNIADMSDDAASGAGEAIMDRILYIKGTPAARSASAVAGFESVPKTALKPARRGPVSYLLAGPIKVVTASTDYVSEKTKASPFWTSSGFAVLNAAGMLRLMVANGELKTHIGAGVGWTIVGLGLMALLYMGYGMAMEKAKAEKETVRKMNDAVAANEASLKAVPGVVDAYGETIPGGKAHDHVIVVRVKTLGTGNLNKIPLSIDGFPVKVQFVR